jgi:hypothetical protein
VKYTWIREHRDSFPVAVQCDALEVSASGYYAWLAGSSAEPSRPAVRLSETFSSSQAASLGAVFSYLRTTLFSCSLAAA